MPRLADADLRANADRQSAAFFRAAGAEPWATLHDEPDVIHGTTGIPLAIFNGATGARFEPATADERIEAVLRPFREQAIDMSWWVGPTSTPVDLATRIAARGLVVDEEVPILARLLDGWTAEPPAAGIEIERVSDPAGYRVATDIMFEAFGLPRGVFDVVVERYAGLSIGPRAVQHTYLARLDGRAVGTSLGFVVEGVVGVYNVATLEDARRRGVGAAITAAAVAGGLADGAVATLLETSPLGRPVYERLGFREIGSVTILVGAFGSSSS
ncbi:MAG: GNAT family N-acetyltransferase [Candidatus Limnocylindrales bacterium]